MSLLVLSACGGDDGVRPRQVDPTATTTTGNTGDTAATEEPGTGDTAAPVDTGPIPGPACAAGSCVYLTSDELGDTVGRPVDVADMDGDGRAEALVTESASVPADQGTSAVYILSGAPGSGLLRDHSRVTFEGSADFPYYWGAQAALLPGAGQVVVNGGPVSEASINVFDVPAGAAVVQYGDKVGTITTPTPFNEFGIPSMLADCATLAGPALCLTSINSDTEVVGNNAGQVFLYDAPIVGDVHVLDARSRFLGDASDGARIVDGDSDLDADGVRDLAVGAFYAGGTGRIALIVDPPAGEHRLWDVAGATLTGTTFGERLGMGLATGDLDDDGYGDVLAGAPLAAIGRAFVARGPHVGDRSVAELAWTFTAEDGGWFGYELAMGDFDGDGAMDLAIGAPLFDGDGNEAGNVFVFTAPPPGTYTTAEATLSLESGVGLADELGISLAAGDLDGDGRDDLVVGAPRDPTVAESAGSAVLWYGAGL